MKYFLAIFCFTSFAQSPFRVEERISTNEYGATVAKPLVLISVHGGETNRQYAIENNRYAPATNRFLFEQDGTMYSYDFVGDRTNDAVRTFSFRPNVKDEFYRARLLPDN